jgi:hypothetical protein
VDDQNCCPSRDRDGLCYLSIVVTQKGPAAADVDAGNDKKWFVGDGFQNSIGRRWGQINDDNRPAE